MSEEVCVPEVVDDENKSGIGASVAKVAGGVAVGTLMIGSLFWHLLCWLVGLGIAAWCALLGWDLMGHGFWKSCFGIILLLGGGSSVLTSLVQVIVTIGLLVSAVLSSFGSHK